MQPTVTIKRLGWLAAATIVLGVRIGVGAGLLTLLLYGVEHVLLGYIEGPELPGPFGVPAARRAISVTVGLSIAGIIWYLLRHKTIRITKSAGRCSIGAGTVYHQDTKKCDRDRHK